MHRLQTHRLQTHRLQMLHVLWMCLLPALLLACTAAAVEGDTEPATQSVGEEGEGPMKVSMDQPFRLAVGERVLLGDDPLEIGFVGVSSDSRCPRDVQCIWEGDAAVDLWVITAAGERIELQLHTTKEPREEMVGNHVIRLQELEPTPVSTSTIAPEDYLATLTVSD